MGISESEPRWWLTDHSAFGQAAGPHRRPITWRPAVGPEQGLLRAAAQRQHELAIKLENAIALGQRKQDHEPADLREFAPRLAVLSYDTMWAALRGRTRMTVLHIEDIATAAAALQGVSRNSIELD